MNERILLLKAPTFPPILPAEEVAELCEWLCMNVLKKMHHRHFVFGIPKMVRRCFLHDRKLLADMSRCARESLKIFIQEVVPENDPIPGAVIAVQAFCDFLININNKPELSSRPSRWDLLRRGWIA